MGDPFFVFMRLDRLIGHLAQLGRSTVRTHLATGHVSVNGTPESNGLREIGSFETVTLEGRTLQSRTPRYVLLHKPAGIVSATTDLEHRTVIDLIDEPWAPDLHLAGRLDRATTGLVILTNDGTFSTALTEPGAHVPKTYLVTTDKPVSPEALAAFRAGMPFAKERTITQPAIAHAITPTITRLTIYEGKHHQVKRMFSRFEIKVIALHRESIGRYTLENLPPGEYRIFDAREEKQTPAG